MRQRPHLDYYRPMRGIAKSVVSCLFCLTMMGCASSTVEELSGNVDSGVIPGELPVPKDASVVDARLPQTPPDAAPPVLIDAAIPPVDAAPPAGGGLFCDDSSDCASTHCCLAEICVRGDEFIPGLCIPN